MVKVLKTQKAVHVALERLDKVQQFVISHLFGLNSCSPANYEEIADLLCKKLSPEQLFAFSSKPNPKNDKALISVADIKEIEANALRALAHSASRRTVSKGGDTKGGDTKGGDTKGGDTLSVANINGASTSIQENSHLGGVNQLEGGSELTDDYEPDKDVKIVKIKEWSDK